MSRIPPRQPHHSYCCCMKKSDLVRLVCHSNTCGRCQRGTEKNDVDKFRRKINKGNSKDLSFRTKELPVRSKLNSEVAAAVNERENLKSQEFVQLTGRRIQSLQMQLDAVKNNEKGLVEALESCEAKLEKRDNEIKKLKKRMNTSSTSEPGGSTKKKDKKVQSLDLETAQAQLDLLLNRNAILEENIKTSLLKEHDAFMDGKVNLNSMLQKEFLTELMHKSPNFRFSTYDDTNLMIKIEELEKRLQRCCKEKSQLKIKLKKTLPRRSSSDSGLEEIRNRQLYDTRRSKSVPKGAYHSTRTGRFKANEEDPFLSHRSSEEDQMKSVQPGNRLKQPYKKRKQKPSLSDDPVYLREGERWNQDKHKKIDSGTQAKDEAFQPSYQHSSYDKEKSNSSQTHLLDGDDARNSSLMMRGGQTLTNVDGTKKRSVTTPISFQSSAPQISYGSGSDERYSEYSNTFGEESSSMNSSKKMKSSITSKEEYKSSTGISQVDEKGKHDSQQDTSLAHNARLSWKDQQTLKAPNRASAEPSVPESMINRKDKSLKTAKSAIKNESVSLSRDDSTEKFRSMKKMSERDGNDDEVIDQEMSHDEIEDVEMPRLVDTSFENEQETKSSSRERVGFNNKDKNPNRDYSKQQYNALRIPEATQRSSARPVRKDSELNETDPKATKTLYSSKKEQSIPLDDQHGERRKVKSTTLIYPSVGVKSSKTNIKDFQKNAKSTSIKMAERTHERRDDSSVSVQGSLGSQEISDSEGEATPTNRSNKSFSPIEIRSPYESIRNFSEPSDSIHPIDAITASRSRSTLYSSPSDGNTKKKRKERGVEKEVRRESSVGKESTFSNDSSPDNHSLESINDGENPRAVNLEKVVTAGSSNQSNVESAQLNIKKSTERIRSNVSPVKTSENMEPDHRKISKTGLVRDEGQSLNDRVSDEEEQEFLDQALNEGNKYVDPRGNKPYGNTASKSKKLSYQPKSKNKKYSKEKIPEQNISDNDDSNIRSASNTIDQGKNSAEICQDDIERVSSTDSLEPRAEHGSTNGLHHKGQDTYAGSSKMKSQLEKSVIEVPSKRTKSDSNVSREVKGSFRKPHNASNVAEFSEELPNTSTLAKNVKNLKGKQNRNSPSSRHDRGNAGGRYEEREVSLDKNRLQNKALPSEQRISSETTISKGSLGKDRSPPTEVLYVSRRNRAPRDFEEQLRRRDARISELQEKLRELMAVNDSSDGRKLNVNLLERKLRDSEMRAEKSRQDVNDLRSALMKKQSSLERIQRQLRQSPFASGRESIELNKWKRELQEENIKLENALSKESEVKKDLEEQVKLLKSELSRKNGAIKSMQDKIVSVTQENADRVNDFSVQHRSMESKKEFSERLLKDKERENAFLKDELEKIKRELQEARSVRDSSLSEKRLARISETRIRNEIDDLKDKLTKSAHNNDELRRKIEAYIENVKMIEELLEQKDHEFQSLLAQFNDANSERDSLIQERQAFQKATDSAQATSEKDLTIANKLSRANDLILEYEKQINDLSEELETIRSHATRSKSENFQFKNDLAEARAIISRTEIQLDEMSSELFDIKSQNRRLAAYKKDADANLEKLRSQLQQLVTEKEELEEKFRSCSDNVEINSDVIAKLTREIDEKRLELEESRRKSRNLEDKLEANLSELSRLRHEVQKTERKLSEKESDLKIATAEILDLRNKLSTTSASRLLDLDTSFGTTASASGTFTKMHGEDEGESDDL